jgi:hypothetical protein
VRSRKRRYDAVVKIDAGGMFVSEPITPEPGSFSTELMAQGLASQPGAFFWRNRRYAVVECISHAKQSSREGARAGGELYLRRQEFTVRLDSGQIARIYVLRQGSRPASGPTAAAKARWFLYSISTADSGEQADRT